MLPPSFQQEEATTNIQKRTFPLNLGIASQQVTSKQSLFVSPLFEKASLFG